MKKKIALFLCVLACVSFCFACADREYWGVYKEQQSGDADRVFYLELKSGGRCEYYGLRAMETKEKVKEDGVDYYEGTYNIEDKTITLYIINTNTINNQTDVWVGTVSKNSLEFTFDDEMSRTFKKQ